VNDVERGLEEDRKEGDASMRRVWCKSNGRVPPGSTSEVWANLSNEVKKRKSFAPRLNPHFFALREWFNRIDS